jgi:hypothetical protein
LPEPAQLPALPESPPPQPETPAESQPLISTGNTPHSTGNTPAAIPLQSTIRRSPFLAWEEDNWSAAEDDQVYCLAEVVQIPGVW